MSTTSLESTAPSAPTLDRTTSSATIVPVLAAISLCHGLNDLMQSLLPAAYPVLHRDFSLSFGQIGLLSLVYQITASILQPLVGLYTDHRPKPYSLPFAMLASMTGLLTLAFGPDFHTLLFGAALLGLGSSIFHPESSRIARLASGGAHGLAQSVFQVGGNLGSSLGPLAAAFVVLPRGQHGLAWAVPVAVVGIVVMTWISRWYQSTGHATRTATRVAARHPALSRAQVWRAMAVLVMLLFSKYIYLASITNYYPFYLMDRFGLTAKSAQLYQFVFFAAVAIGTILGGPIGDRIGRKRVIWVSILGVLPFTLALPHVGLGATVVLSVIIGLFIASAFPAIVVYAQELIPGRTGMVSGVFFGLAFGIGGIGAALLGGLADRTGINYVYQLCAFLPALGLFTALLPSVEHPAHDRA